MTVELLSLGSVHFDLAEPEVPPAPTRADIACIVGFVRRRSGPLPPGLQGWLERRGWLAGPYRRPAFALDLLDVPVPIDGWDVFDSLFAWEDRTAEPGAGSCYLGAAVRSFFAQGGHRCYVIRVGDTWSPGEARAPRVQERMQRLLPGWNGGALPVPDDRAGWHGVAHLFGLPDAALLLLPDLPDLFAADPEPEAPPPARVPPEPVFEACSAGELAPVPTREPVPFRAPRLGEAQYAGWALALNAVSRFLAEQLRRWTETQLIAAVPLPAGGDRAAHQLPGFLAERFLNRGLDQGGLGTSFVQLVYPWVVTPGSTALPESLEPPDGALAGLVARRTLIRGAYFPAANQDLADVQELAPALTRADLAVPDRGVQGGLTVFPDRISILGRTPAGLRLLSDVTPSIDPAYRPASVARLMAVILRNARALGQRLVWEPSGERLWERIRVRLDGLMETLWREGVLRGGSSTEAFTVRCDASTMTQADLDAGRVIATVSFQAAAPIDRISVTLFMDQTGGVVLGVPAA